MLPFALKLVWCVLCSLGTIASWTMVMALGSLPGPMWWATLSFCIALTILEGIFCLGMIWRMNPFAMPRAFCVAQTIIMEASLFALGGINTAGCIATSLHVLKPKKWGDAAASFRWRPIYIIPAVVCPVIASAVQITLVFKLDAVQPADDMHCDAIDPLWVRLVAHVISIVLFFPTVYLSVTSWRRVARTVKHVERALDDNALHHQIRRERPNEHHTSNPARDCQFIEPALPEQAANASTRKLPFFRHLHSISQPLRPPLLSPSPIEDDDERMSAVSSTFPTFAPVDGKPDTQHARRLPEEHDVSRTELRTMSSTNSIKPTSDTGYESDREREIDSKSCEEDGTDGTHRLSYSKRATTTSRVSHLANIPTYAPQLRRLLLAQLVFPFLIVFMSLSSIIDVAAAATRPMSFGSHHVVLLVAAWGPALTFGPSRCVREQVRAYFARWRR